MGGRAERIAWRACRFASSKLISQNDPGAGELTDDERRQEIRGELCCAVASDGRSLGDARPQCEHDQRHGRRQHPDQHLRAVGHRFDEPDTKQRRKCANRGAQAHGDCFPSPHG